MEDGPLKPKNRRSLCQTRTPIPSEGGQVLSEDGNLLDVIIDTPCTRTAGGEKSQIACSKLPFFAFLVGNEDLTGR